MNQVKPSQKLTESLKSEGQTLDQEKKTSNDAQIVNKKKTWFW
jgi:hypothetical protein